jgi:hypothetical protein
MLMQRVKRICCRCQRDKAGFTSATVSACSRGQVESRPRVSPGAIEAASRRGGELVFVDLA